MSDDIEQRLKRLQGTADAIFWLVFFIGASLMGWSIGDSWSQHGWNNVLGWFVGYATTLGVAIWLRRKLAR